MVDYGRNPVSNRFSKSREYIEGADHMYDISLGYCTECGHIQLTDKIPINAIRPIYSWITYSEPEDHLDDLTAELFKYEFITEKSKILGSTYKDNSLLERFSTLNVRNTKEVNSQDLFIFDSHIYGVETIVEQLSKHDVINSIKNKYGLFDLIVTRHTVEHAIDSRKFLLSLKQLLNNGGRMLIEIPDNDYMFKSGNHAFVWEEHISYFTENSIQDLCSIIGAKTVFFRRYQYSYEDSLVVLMEFDKSTNQPTYNANRITSNEILLSFYKSLQSEKNKWNSAINRYKRDNLTVAVFGANHLAVRFINYFELAEIVDYVIDDNPNKIGRFMPGSKIPIIGSVNIIKKDINICISTLSPESEKIVFKKMKYFIDNGGKFIKAFKSKK